MRPLGLESASLLLHSLPRGMDSAASANRPGSQRGTLESAASEFETLIVQKMLETMRASVGQSGLLQRSAHRKVLEGSFDRQMAEHLVRDGGGLGLVDELAGAARGARDERRVLPVEGRLSSSFGHRRDPLSGAQRFHGGVDLAAPAGTPIRAAASGEVVFSGRRGAAGNLVMVRHQDGSVAHYAHARELAVRKGDQVAAGQEIASVGSTGRSTGPHLHFAVRQGERRLDPLEWLEGAAQDPQASQDRQTAAGVNLLSRKPDTPIGENT